jgi:hypothetical protein
MLAVKNFTKDPTDKEMNEYTIRCLTNGMGPQREKSRFTWLNFAGQKVDVPYIIWYIEGAEKKILVQLSYVNVRTHYFSDACPDILYCQFGP